MSHIKLRYPNGWALSVIDDGYGASDGLYEIAVLTDDQIVDAHVLKLPHANPNDKVVGWLTATEVNDIAAHVAALPTREEVNT